MSNRILIEAIPNKVVKSLAVVLGIALACDCVPQASAQVKVTPPAVRQAPAKSNGPTRVEKDLLGEKEIPADAYYGVQTARALENFQISGIPINHYPGFVEAWAIVKLAAARANTEVGAMKKETLDAIEKATREVLD